MPALTCPRRPRSAERLTHGLTTSLTRTASPDARAATGLLEASSVCSIQLPLNFGPQHLAFPQDGRFLYLLGEMSGLIAVFERNAATGGLERVQRVPMGAGANWIQVVRVT